MNNLEILENNDIRICGRAWDDRPESVELETSTDAGEDMIFCLEEPTAKCLQEYIDNFDIDEQVMLWWAEGKAAAHAKGVPFDSISEHYEDYKAYLERLQGVVYDLHN